jgi:hypothetical protein
MSRAMNLRLSEADVRSHCIAAGISISAIEPLPAGGTHLVCVTGEGADEIRLRFRDHVIPGVVRRLPFYRAREALVRNSRDRP